MSRRSSARPSAALARLVRSALRLAPLVLASMLAASPALAKPKGKPAKAAKTKEDKEFEKRLASLKSDPANVVTVKMMVTDDPSSIPLPDGMAGTVLVASHRQIYTPELLSPGDMLDVINKNMIDVRKCYKKQLEEDPEWTDELILDLSVKKNGRVSEVSISPRRVRRDTIGSCLMSTIPKWKFPQFTGETDDGITQEVVNASFPFSLSPG